MPNAIHRWSISFCKSIQHRRADEHAKKKVLFLYLFRSTASQSRHPARSARAVTFQSVRIYSDGHRTNEIRSCRLGALHNPVGITPENLFWTKCTHTSNAICCQGSTYWFFAFSLFTLFSVMGSIILLKSVGTDVRWLGVGRWCAAAAASIIFFSNCTNLCIWKSFPFVCILDAKNQTAARQPRNGHTQPWGKLAQT